jgi:hypothetical protein
MEIYEVFEVQWPSMEPASHSTLFTNFIAAEKYMQSYTSWIYERHMAIRKAKAFDNWPLAPVEFFDDNEITYYKQVDGKFVEFSP